MERRGAKGAVCHQAGRKCPSEAGQSRGRRPQGPARGQWPGSPEESPLLGTQRPWCGTPEHYPTPCEHRVRVHTHVKAHTRVHAAAQPSRSLVCWMVPPGRQHVLQRSSTWPSHLTGPKEWSSHRRGPALSLGTGASAGPPDHHQIRKRHQRQALKLLGSCHFLPPPLWVQRPQRQQMTKIKATLNLQVGPETWEPVPFTKAVL